MRFKLLFLFLLFVNGVLFAQETSVQEGREGNAIKELFFAGLKEKMAENYANASLNFSKILTIDPKNDAVYFELASLNYRQNKLLDAETAIKQAISLNPKNSWYLKLQAEIYKRNGNMESLVSVFNQLIQLSPETDTYYFDRANALFIAGKTEDLKKAYDEIEQKFGSSKELTFAKQRFVIQGNETPNDDAISKLLAENPTDVKSYLYLSGVLLDKDKKKKR